jgi:Protein of unknown function (DUF3800)
LPRLVEILAPGDGDLVVFLECYFDESGSDAGSPVLCVAGYLFEKEQCKALDLKWKEVLDRYKLPYFRMSACAHNKHPFPVEPFCHLSPQECIPVEKELIRLINDHALLGLAVVVNEAEYQSWFAGRRVTGGSAYTFCCWQILAGIRTWMNRNQFAGEVGYFYEAGHDSQSEANALMHRIFNNPGLKAGYRYAGHGFVDKVKSRPVQAADILAWQQATQVKRWMKNNYKIRADFQALAERPPHELFVANRRTMGGVIAYSGRLEGLTAQDGITGAWENYWFWSPFDGREGFVQWW